MSESITALVLAGGPADAVAALQPGAANKAFLRIGGVPLVTRVLSALHASPSVGHLRVVAPQGTHKDPALTLADDMCEDGKKISESLRNGLRDLNPDQFVLVSASDLPLLDIACIEDFIARARNAHGEINYGCVHRRVHLMKFPEVPHTWVHLRDGAYCGGGFVMMRPRVMSHLEHLIERLGAARKSPFRLAQLFGFPTLVRYALRSLSLAACEERGSQLLGAPARAIVSPYAQTAVNIDRVTDVALTEHLIHAYDTFMT